MKHGLAMGLIGMLLAAVSVRAEEAFSKIIRPEDFAAAELGKLSPEALARLDELVAAYKRGAVATVRAEAAAEVQAVKVAAETEKAKAKPESPGLFAKAKVMLSPGTKVEYGEIESRIAGEFTGWEGHTVFTLENGQRWRVANGGQYVTDPLSHPKVRIYPATLGGFWLVVEGAGPRVKVLPLE